MAKDFLKGAVASAAAAAKNPSVRKAGEALLAAAGAALAKHLENRIERSRNNSKAERIVEPLTAELPVDYMEEDPGMATLGEVEAQIRLVERLPVSFIHRKSARDARDDRRGFNPYPFVNKASDDLTISDLVNRRLAQYEMHGLKAVIKYPNNELAHRRTRLREVRKAFEAP